MKENNDLYTNIDTNNNQIPTNSSTTQNSSTSSKTINYAGETALSLSLLIVLVFLVCLIIPGGVSETMLLAAFYCAFCEIPVTIVSIIFGLIGLKEKNKTTSYISLVINTIKIIITVLLILIN